ncbi:MAG: WHG domain-containing protein [Actinobacteria bacterium]|nr:WHG domain-containing protein [Actinomycetota bacterium]
MPRAGLTQERVVEEAERLADEVGLGAVSLAALAERLGVKVPSLYKHVDGLPALHRLIEARSKLELAEVMGRATVGRARDDALDGLAAAYRDWATRHPGRYEATVRAPAPDDEASLAASERAVGIMFDALAGYGLSGDDAVDATRSFRAAIHGFIALEAVGGFGMPRDVDRTFERLVAALRLSLNEWARVAV